jgi:hypothetical protein
LLGYGIPTITTARPRLSLNINSFKLNFRGNTIILSIVGFQALFPDPHLYNADLDPAFLLNADPQPFFNQDQGKNIPGTSISIKKIRKNNFNNIVRNLLIIFMCKEFICLHPDSDPG